MKNHPMILKLGREVFPNYTAASRVTFQCVESEIIGDNGITVWWNTGEKTFKWWHRGETVPLISPSEVFVLDKLIDYFQQTGQFNYVIKLVAFKEKYYRQQ